MRKNENSRLSQEICSVIKVMEQKVFSTSAVIPAKVDHQLDVNRLLRNYIKYCEREKGQNLPCASFSK